MELTSPAFTGAPRSRLEYAREGGGAFPVLRLTGVPAQTRSLAIIVHDPDLPKSRRPSGIFDHWVVWNLPPDTSIITDPAGIPGVVGSNSRGEHGYVPPAPPPGDGSHRYYFRAYALDTDLGLPESTDRDGLLDAMSGHVIAEAELMGRYQSRATPAP